MKLNIERKLKLVTGENGTVKEEPVMRNPNIFLPDTTFPNNTIECTICAEPILNYEPTLFNGIEMNPACDICKNSSSDGANLSKKINTCANKLPNFTKADQEIISKRLKPEEKIRKKVKEKLEVRFLNGEIKREEMQELEEELVRDLELNF